MSLLDSTGQLNGPSRKRLPWVAGGAVKAVSPEGGGANRQALTAPKRGSMDCGYGRS